MRSKRVPSALLHYLLPPSVACANHSDITNQVVNNLKFETMVKLWRVLSLLFFAACGITLRACLHGKRVPLGDRSTLPTRVEDIFVLRANFEHGRPSLAGSRAELNCPYLGGEGGLK